MRNLNVIMILAVSYVLTGCAHHPSKKEQIADLQGQVHTIRYELDKLQSDKVTLQFMLQEQEATLPPAPVCQQDMIDDLLAHSGPGAAPHKVIELDSDCSWAKLSAGVVPSNWGDYPAMPPQGAERCVPAEARLIYQVCTEHPASFEGSCVALVHSICIRE